MKMEQLETISRGHHLKIYESPAIKHHLVGAALSLLADSVKKTVSNSMKEEWEEEVVTETFEWEW